MSSIGAFRFFRVVSLHSPLTLFALGAVGLVTMGGMVASPATNATAAVPVVFVQMIAASTGFGARARRGHLDLLLTGGSSRLRVATAHLAMSIAPGVAVWLVLGLTEIAATRGGSSTTLSTGSAVAILVVSALAWAASVPYPPLTGGIAWMLVMVTLVAISPYGRDVMNGASRPSPGAGAVFYLLCPFLLIGRAIGVGDFPAVVPAAVVSLSAVAAAFTWIRRMDVPLEASQ